MDPRQTADPESANYPQSLPESEALAKRLYTIPDLVRLTGMTRKQVAYWAQIHLVVPTMHISHSGGGRPAYFYAATEVVKALVICELRRRGFSLRQVQQVARNLQEHGIRLHESQSYLLTDGHSVYYAENDNQVIDILKDHRQMLLLVPIHDQVAKLMEAA